MTASTSRYRVELTATTQQPGTALRAPTAQGLVFACRDTMHGYLTLKLWQRQAQGDSLLLTATSSLCGVEVGGAPWDTVWSTL